MEADPPTGPYSSAHGRDGPGPTRRCASHRRPLDWDRHRPPGAPWV